MPARGCNSKEHHVRCTINNNSGLEAMQLDFLARALYEVY